jgi:superfamily II DNA or RNA helicase
MMWETTAKTRDDLYQYEEVLHNKFIKYRMMRYIPGDSEWFDFAECEAIETIAVFMQTMTWVTHVVNLSDVIPAMRHRFLRKNFGTNTHFIHTDAERTIVLNRLQAPVINAIHTFAVNPSQSAGIVIAPCGAGKTMMCCSGINGLTKVIICCPSNQIQRQWHNTLVSQQIFRSDDILLISSSKNGTTDKETIAAFMQHEKTYCVITTYMSSNILVDLLDEHVQLLVLDEAHHLGGVIGSDDDGEGKTRRLMMRATEQGVKRLSLTFTPRYIKSEDSCDSTYASMDDERIFGSPIAEVQLRDLITAGVLPDYRVWSLRDSSKKGNGIIGKADCILEAWKARNVVRGTEDFILHHLVVFASTNEEAMTLETYFINNTIDTTVIRVEGGDRLEGPLRKFANAKRSIIVNCKVLGEGVDVPIANAVAITYPKRSRCETVQMLLRAGRWYANKALFHIILPVLDDDVSGFENTLTALASHDTQIYDEIVVRAHAMVAPVTKEGIEDANVEDGSVAESIIIDDYDGSNVDQIRTCFINIRNKFFPDNALSFAQTKRLLATHQIMSKSAYYSLCKKDPRFPKEPELAFKDTFTNWIDYLSIERKYYDLATCKTKMNDYPDIQIDRLNLVSVCAQLCNADPLFPPKDFWIDYYHVTHLDKVLEGKNARKQQFVRSL